MITVRKEESLFWKFVSLAVFAELFGFACQWFFGVTGSFLVSPMWHGWFGAILYGLIWIYAAIVWVVCLICSYVCIYGGWLISLLVVLIDAGERRRSKNETFRIYVQFQARKLLGTYEDDRGFGSKELSGFLNSIHATILAHVRTERIEFWVNDSFSKNTQVMKLMRESYLVIKYGKGGNLPELLMNNAPFPTH
jgi:hypothetical protein